MSQQLAREFHYNMWSNLGKETLSILSYSNTLIADFHWTLLIGARLLCSLANKWTPAPIAYTPLALHVKLLPVTPFS